MLAPPAAVTLRRQWDCSAKGESSPCRISLLNPLLCAGTKSTKERNQITRAALAGCATVSGPEVNSLIFPVPPTEGAGLDSLAFCVSLSGGVKRRERMSRGWSITHAAPQTGGRTGAVLPHRTCPPPMPRLSTGLEE